MADSFRMRLSGSRDQLLDDLESCTGEKTRAKAVEKAARAYLRLVGGNVVQPGPGLLDELLEAADRRDLSGDEIARVLDVDELPLKFEPASWSVGNVDD